MMYDAALASYIYNPNGLRSVKTAGNRTKCFVYNGMNIAVEHEEKGAEYTDFFYGLNRYTMLPDVLAVRQSGNLYAYCAANPIRYADLNGEFIISTTVLVVAGLAAIGAAVGGYIGAKVADKQGKTGRDKVSYDCHRRNSRRRLCIAFALLSAENAYASS